VSPYSPQTQEKIDRYDELLVKRTRLSMKESAEFEQLSLFVEMARPIGGPPEPGSLQSRIEAYLEKALP
jgi:hypothetical protein